MKKRNYLVLAGLFVAVSLLVHTLQPGVPPTRGVGDQLMKLTFPPPVPSGWDPTRKQEGGADERRSWEEMRLADPVTGRIPADIHRREQEFASKLPIRRGSALLEVADLNQAAGSDKINGWGYRGPWNVGGRTRALAIDVSDPTYQTLLAGGVSGGMWRTINDGSSWTLTTGSSQLHSVSTIAQDTREGHQDVWYYGTGEYRGNSAYGGGGAYYHGDGLFKSTNGGQTWALLPATSGTPPSSFTWNWQYVWRVAVDPSNSAQDEVYAATFRFILRSVDGGASFDRILGDDTTTISRYNDVIVSSTGVVYASLSSDGAVAGIFRSPNGITWTDITPAGLTDHRRIVMALAPSDENIMYCQVADIDGTDNAGFFKYFYFSGDGSGSGGFWQDRSAQMAALPGPSGNVPMETYNSYCMEVAVHPSNPDIVYLGGVHLYRSTDGFATNYNDTWIGGWQYLDHHADQHAMLFQPGSTTIAYTGSDGGVHKTLNAMAGTVAWSPLNNGYNTSQFYATAIDENLPGSNIVVGGMQDNGSWFNNSLDPTNLWVINTGGDGSYCAVVDASGAIGTYLYSSQYGVMYRLTVDHNTGDWVTGTRMDPTDGGDYLFINPFIIDPNDTKMVYLATSNGVWRNTNLYKIPDYTGAPTMINWDHLTTVPAGEFVTALAMSRSADRILYYGTAEGHVYRLDHADTAPESSIPTPLSMGPYFDAGSYVSSIAIHPDDDQKVLLGVSNYTVVSLFYTEDGGASWTRHEGNLSGTDGPSVRDVAIVPYGGIDIYFAGTSTGLYSTFYLAGGATDWHLEASDLIGNVVVDQLATRPADGLIVAATHGKGVYSITIPVGTAVDDVEIPQPTRLAQNVPNPFNPMTTISFSIPAAGPATLAVYDVAGKLVRTLIRQDLEAGDHQATWNGSDEGGHQVAAGVYLYRLDSGSVHEVKRMTLIR